MLTVKQEKFVQNIVSGMSQREAYKGAYNTKNMSDKTIDNEASKLFNTPKITARYKELLEKLEDESIMNVKERMVWLTEVVNGAQREGVKVKMPGNEEIVIGEGTADLNTKIKAIDILNRMSGVYMQKVEIKNSEATQILSSINNQLKNRK